MIKRGEHTSGPARPDEKMGNESARNPDFQGPRTSKYNQFLKRVMAKKRRQHEKHVLDGR